MEIAHETFGLTEFGQTRVFSSLRPKKNQESEEVSDEVARIRQLFKTRHNRKPAYMNQTRTARNAGIVTS